MLSYNPCSKKKASDGRVVASVIDFPWGHRTRWTDGPHDDHLSWLLVLSICKSALSQKRFTVAAERAHSDPSPKGGNWYIIPIRLARQEANEVCLPGVTWYTWQGFRHSCAQLSIVWFALIVGSPCRVGMRCQSGSRLADGGREGAGYSKVVILWTVRRVLKLSLSLLSLQGDRKLLTWWISN